MTARFNLRPNEHLGRPAAKQALNQALFTEVAPRYDFVTRALSLGRDRSWKRRLIAGLPDRGSPFCIDLACGTGDLTRLLAARFPYGQVCGMDLTPAMLDLAKKHSPEENINYIEGTMDSLPFETRSAEIVTGGYALRNAPDLDRAIREIDRVLCPGGIAAFIDFSKPPSRLGQAAHHAVLKTWGGFWGLMLHGNTAVYGYIADSLRFFPDRVELQERFIEQGFTSRSRHLVYGGLLELSVFRKPGTEGL